MKQSIRFLCVLMLCLTLANNVAASQTYSVEVGDRPVSLSGLAPYSAANEIMVPLLTTNTALGGISPDMSIGEAYYCAILNGKIMILVTGMNFYLVMPTSDILAWVPESEDYSALIADITSKLMDGTIEVFNIDFPISEQAGDVYLPLDIMTDVFDLQADVEGTTIQFASDYQRYNNLPTKSLLTFHLDIEEKKYDGKPIFWSDDRIEIRCNGKPVTDYWPLTYTYLYTNMSSEVTYYDEMQMPLEAGSYTIVIETDPDDPKYSGTGYLNFMIYPEELTLIAEDKTVSEGEEFQSLSYRISGLIPGDSEADAIVKEPVLSVPYYNTNVAGTYPIEITGGRAGNNYTIVGYIDGTLTVTAEKREASIKIKCVDEDTGEIIWRDKQWATVGELVTIQAPVFDGYDLLGQDEEQIRVKENSVVTFYYVEHEEVIEPEIPEYEAYITGYTDGTFRPQNNIKRSECVAMIYRLMEQTYDGLPIFSGAAPFSDIPYNAWYGSALNVLTAMDIIGGYEDNTFRPENTITRGEFVVMALRYAGITPNSSPYHFVDVPQNHWAADYIQTAAQYGWLSGYTDGTFRPQQSITRAEAVSILNKLDGRDQYLLPGYGATSFIDVPTSHWAYQAIMLAANRLR